MVLHNHGLHASYKFDVIEVRSYVASSFVYIMYSDSSAFPTFVQTWLAGVQV